MEKIEKPICDNCIVKSKSYFNKLEKNDLLDLSINKKCKFYKKGQTIFYEGDRPLGIYCLNYGKVKIFKIGMDGKEQIVRFVFPGDLLGFRSLIGEEIYSASATTLENSFACFISKHVFFQLIKKYPYISHNLMTSLCHLLEEAENKMTSLAQKTVKKRLAESLLLLNKNFNSNTNNGIDYTILLSRRDLANIVGTATETVIRLLSEFNDEKLISIKGRKITLLNIDKLMKKADIID